jgi:hypothetical protein
MAKSLPLCTALLVTTLACGSPNSPSESVAGDWVAQVGHSDFAAMQLEQGGDNISGVACFGSYSFPGAVGTPRTVSGDYPHVRFGSTNRFDTVNNAFDGKYEKDRDQIAGDWGTLAQHTSLRFSRGGRSNCTSSAP